MLNSISMRGYAIIVSTVISILLVTTACSTLQEKLNPTASIVLDLTVLDAQYDLAVSNYRALELNEPERIASEDAFARLDATRTYLKSVDRVDVAIMTLLRSQETLDGISQAYTMLEDTYVSYVNRSGIDPDPTFVAISIRANDLILTAYALLESVELPDERLVTVTNLMALLLEGAALAKQL